MLFNSIEFGVFLPIVFLLYWYVFQNNIKLQNTLLLVSSYFFYGCWDWRFLALILFSTIVDFIVARGIATTLNLFTRKILLFSSIAVNIGLLFFFKYYNFFVESFIQTFQLLGTDFNANTLQIILPVGISFYTFQTLSYTLDVYGNKIKPSNDFIVFASYVSFFPQLVAGPIERATNLLPQFSKKRTFDYTKSIIGLRQILWGLFKKIVIADNCAEFANVIFDNYTQYSGGTLFLGALFFTFQIYGDFSGYSDIAIGTARLFGFDLMKNFNFPYFSRDIPEFWRRWHISLSTWFRDYLYIPLGGSKGGKRIRNTFIIFIVSGFWHGANWTFIFWGLLNALYFMPYLLLGKNRSHLGNIAEGRYLPTFKEFLQIGTTFLLTTITWVFFRANNLSHAFSYIRDMFVKTSFSISELELISRGGKIKYTLVLLCIFIIVEWIQRNREFGLDLEKGKLPKVFRLGIYYSIVLCIVFFKGGQQDFIYFQF